MAENMFDEWDEMNCQSTWNCMSNTYQQQWVDKMEEHFDKMWDQGSVQPT